MSKVTSSTPPAAYEDNEKSFSSVIILFIIPPHLQLQLLNIQVILIVFVFNLWSQRVFARLFVGFSILINHVADTSHPAVGLTNHFFVIDNYCIAIHDHILVIHVVFPIFFIIRFIFQWLYILEGLLALEFFIFSFVFETVEDGLAGIVLLILDWLTLIIIMIREVVQIDYWI